MRLFSAAYIKLQCFLLLSESATRLLGAPWKLHMMPERGLAGEGAVCIDGSDAGFYYGPAATAEGSKTWVLYFEGGGWCYDELDCWGRSEKDVGTSKNWPKVRQGSGLTSDDCSVNPTLCNAHHVILMYCDGDSFSGNRDEPVKVIGPGGVAKELYFRGKRILDAILDTLLVSKGLSDAETVLLTGGSAGGLAAYLHADYVHKVLKERAAGLKKYRVAPISGFFLKHTTVEGKPVYPDLIKNIFQLANSSGGLNEKCIAAQAPDERWKCNFAEFTYKYIESPIFVFNSALDSWQTGCIYTSEYPYGFPKPHKVVNGNCTAVPGWAACQKSPERCSSGQVEKLNQYISDFSATLGNISTFTKAGNGAFMVSCHTHSEALTNHNFRVFAINGVTMSEAFAAWWHSDNDPAEAHTYSPCFYSTGTPHRCNPTCAPAAPAAFLV
mmetsp:Transcript_25331/g.46385  ORF Transcript_25331/g.46385 Transcript_25331/m.46385 type:complete len:440 (+) Transcript_25331:68-1387(+)